MASHLQLELRARAAQQGAEGGGEVVARRALLVERRERGERQLAPLVHQLEPQQLEVDLPKKASKDG